MYELFRALNDSTSTDSDININDIKQNIIDDFEYSPSYSKIVINNENKDSHIVYQKASSRDTEKKKIMLKPNQTMSVGNYIPYSSKTWILTELDSNISVQHIGIMELCNYNLKFLNDTGDLITRWCVRKEGSYQSAISDEKYFISTDVRSHIILPADSETSKIEIDKRLIIGNEFGYPTAYKVTKVDTVQDYGLALLELESVEVSKTDDDLVNMIADYYSKFSTYSLRILNGDSLNINLSNTLQLNVECTRTQGGNVSTISPTPLINYSSSNVNIATVNSSGLVTFLTTGNVVITAKLASNITVLDSVSITVTNNIEHSYAVEISGESQISYNQTRSYTAIMKDNGVVVSGTQFDFEVIAGSTPSTKYVLTQLSDTSCSIKSLGYPYVITLRCYNRANHSIYIDKNITLKGLV